MLASSAAVAELVGMEVVVVGVAEVEFELPRLEPDLVPPVGIAEEVAGAVDNDFEAAAELDPFAFFGVLVLAPGFFCNSS